MIAQLPSIVVDIGTAAGIVVAFFGALGAGVRWMFIPLVWRPIVKALTDTTVVPAVSSVEADVKEIKHLVRYHLGSNGTTPSIREKVLLLESDVAHIREDVKELKTS